MAIRANGKRLVLDCCRSLARAERIKRMLLETRLFLEVRITESTAPVRPPAASERTETVAE